MKTIDHIPKGKLNRAGKMVSTGLKIGKNYAAHYSGKLVGSKNSREDLDKKNATEIMVSLQQLKGGGLKIAQMLSMEKHLLPEAYTDIFAMARHSVPPMSAPLVKQTFKKSIGKYPEEIYDSFNYKSHYAASIGQVHEATLKGQKLAVKIQYPGVGDSLQSDMAILKPIAGKLMNLSSKDLTIYFDEVQDKLLEETDYKLELENSVKVYQESAAYNGVIVPEYYPAMSSDRILTMDWIDGTHLVSYLDSGISQEERDDYGQRLWDFYMYQFHEMKVLHADPHPGNILITPEGSLAVIDFGCMKEIPDHIYKACKRLLDPTIINRPDELIEVLNQLEILKPGDTPKEHEFFFNLFSEVLNLSLSPYKQDTFDFGDPHFFQAMSTLGQRIAKETLLSKYKPNRGSHHMIYINRTFFGLYQLLHMLGARVTTKQEPIKVAV